MTTAFDKDLELIFQKLTSDRQVKQALDFLKQDAPNTIAQQKELVVIEAPTFQEKQRSLHYAQMLKAAGLQDVTIDEKFNVYAPYGLNDLLGMVIRPNKPSVIKSVYEKKVEKWTKIWPDLKIILWEQI